MATRKQVSIIEELQPGDHIVFNTRLDEHHGIVVSVAADEDEVSVVGAKSGGVIASTTISFSGAKADPVYVVQYDAKECLPAAQVIENALGMLGERVGRNSDDADISGSSVEADGDVDKRPMRLVTKIEDLKPGDHVAFQRTGYEHHGMVISVHPDEDIVNVAEVSKVRTKISFSTRPHTFSKERDDSVFVVEYRTGECLPPSEVIRNASRLDGTSVEYDVLTNNCEHYASKIKTGIAICEQIEHFGWSASKFLPFMVVSKVFSLIKRKVFKQ